MSVPVVKHIRELLGYLDLKEGFRDREYLSKLCDCCGGETLKYVEDVWLHQVRVDV